jgi:death-on-curing protein
MNLQTLSAEEILRIHNILVDDFADDGDPISPSGVKSQSILESAIGRQHVSLGGIMKYSDPIDSAATLLFGICCDHPFHNGNKRTALVAMLAHLDKNKIMLEDVKHNEIYDMVIDVAAHTIAVKPDPRKKDQVIKRMDADIEVAAISDWIRQRTRKITRGERQITFRELRRILEGHGYSMKNPNKNHIDVVKKERRMKGIFNRREVIEEKPIGRIGYPGEGAFVSVQEMKIVRKMCELREEDGCDSTSFYDTYSLINSFVNRYRTVLRRLAAT